MVDDPRDADAAQNEGARPPQEMRLRAPRAPVTRLSRKVLLGLSTAAAIGIGGALVLALRPQHPTTGADLYNTNNPSTPDELAALPKDYTSLPKPVPQLGPPLRGDLGRPILNAGAPAPGIGTPAISADPEQQRLAQEQEAALTSHLFAATDVGQQTSVASTVAPAPASPTQVAAPGSADPTSQDHELAFLNGDPDEQTASLESVQPASSPYVLQAGAVIPAALLTGLNSDLPGQITAQVTEDVYDTPTGTIGQSRALLVWTRLIMPNGTSIVLERQPGTDTEGYAGLSDQVNNHWGVAVQGGDPVHVA